MWNLTCQKQKMLVVLTDASAMIALVIAKHLFAMAVALITTAKTVVIKAAAINNEWFFEAFSQRLAA